MEIELPSHAEDIDEISTLKNILIDKALKFEAGTTNGSETPYIDCYKRSDPIINYGSPDEIKKTLISVKVK